MAAKRKRKRGKRGDGYVTYDARRERWRAVVGGRGKYFRSESEADLWRQAQVAAQSAPPAPPPGPAEQLVKHAIDAMLADRDWLAPTTQDVYGYYAAHVTYYLGELPTGKVTAGDIGAMDRGLRARYVGRVAAGVLMLTNTLYERLIALHPGVITYNPVRAYRAIVPARAREGTPMREPIAVDAGIARRIIRAMDGDPYQAIVLWLFVLGLRSGEARGLRWANVGQGEVAIIEARRPHDRFTPAPIKTERVIGKGRYLPLPAALLQATPVIGHDLVFPNPRDSGALDDATLRSHFHAGCMRAGIDPIRLHDCRHSAGTGLLAVGATEELRAAFLGHTRPGTTARYTHIDPDILRPFVERWAALVLGENAGRLRIGA